LQDDEVASLLGQALLMGVSGNAQVQGDEQAIHNQVAPLVIEAKRLEPVQKKAAKKVSALLSTSVSFAQSVLGTEDCAEERDPLN
jgi:hypothetical protein